MFRGWGTLLGSHTGGGRSLPRSDAEGSWQVDQQAQPECGPFLSWAACSVWALRGVWGVRDPRTLTVSGAGRRVHTEPRAVGRAGGAPSLLCCRQAVLSPRGRRGGSGSAQHLRSGWKDEQEQPRGQGWRV